MGINEKVDCPETVRWFLQRIWKFLFGRFGHWTVSDCEVCDVSDTINFLQQNYCLNIFHTRAKLPDYLNMVFTQPFVMFSSSHCVLLPDLLMGSKSHKFKIRDLYYSICFRNFTICTSNYI